MLVRKYKFKYFGIQNYILEIGLFYLPLNLLRIKNTTNCLLNIIKNIYNLSFINATISNLTNEHSLFSFHQNN